MRFSPKEAGLQHLCCVMEEAFESLVILVPEMQALDEISRFERVFPSLWPLWGEWVLACWFRRHVWCTGAKFRFLAFDGENSFFFFKFKKIGDTPPNAARFQPGWHTLSLLIRPARVCAGHGSGRLKAVCFWGSYFYASGRVGKLA